MDTVLPFGLRSAPKIFTALADTLEWVTRQRAGVSWFHGLRISGHIPSRSKSCCHALVMACVVWGKTWGRKSVLAHCDNQAVVEVVNAGYSRDPHLMQLLHSLFFVTAHLEISLRAIHILGRVNVGADALSRDDLLLFHFQVPEAWPSPTPLPPALPDLLVHSQPDWTLAQLLPVVRDHFCLQTALIPYPVTEDTLLLFIAHLHHS